MPFLTDGGDVRFSKRDKPAPLLIPQRHPHALQTLEQGDSSNGSELRMIAQHSG